MTVTIRRRELLAALGGAAAAWPLAARAQQPTLPVIGFLYPGPPETIAKIVTGFRKGLGELGYVEGRNVAIEYRWGYDESGRLPELAADLVSRPVTVIVTPGSAAAALTAKAATATIPIVYTSGADPVRAGLVVSLNRPGGNVTGINTMNFGLEAKRLELLHQLLDRDARIAVLVNPSGSQAQSMITDLQAAASAMGRQLEILTATTNRDISPAFSDALRRRAGAVLISPDPLFTNRPAQLAILAARHAMPTIYAFREFAEVGGLMSYGASQTEAYRQAGTYTGRVLKGEKPADLPILQATKFEFVVNMRTAEALGIDVPPTLLAIADEVIE